MINKKERIGLYTCEEIYNKYLPQIDKFLRTKTYLPNYSINSNHDDLLQMCSIALVEGYNSYNIDKHPVAFGYYLKALLGYKMKKAYENEFKNKRADYKDRIISIMNSISLESLANEGEGAKNKSSTYKEIIPNLNEENKTEFMVFDIDIKRFMENNLSEKEKEIAYYYYYCDYNQTKIAQIENVSQQQISKSLAKIINGMRKYFDVKESDSNYA